LFEAASNINVASLNNTVNDPTKLRLLKTDLSPFIYYKDTGSVSFEQVNISERERWDSYAIISSKCKAYGWYAGFNAFRDDNITPALVHMAYNNRDRVFYIASSNMPTLGKTLFPWAVSDSVDLYVRTNKTGYLKLYRDKTTFYFYVASASAYANAAYDPDQSGDGSFIFPTAKNILVDLAVVAVEGILKIAVSAIRENNNLRRPPKNYGRYYYINMDTGGILY
jgi:hypothetical protein